MAIAASLNVNLTATSGQFTSTMTKAAGTMKKVGTTASLVGRTVKGFIAASAAKKAFSFISHAVGDLTELAKTAEAAGFSLSKMQKLKLGTAQMDAVKLGAAFAQLKLQFVSGLAPAIQYVTGLFARLTNTTIAGFSLMELAGKSVGAVIVIIGKSIQITAKLLAKALTPFAEAIAGIAVSIAELATKFGDLKTATKFAEIAEKAGKIGQSLKTIDGQLDWEDIFAWPEMKVMANEVKMEAQAVKKELEIPQGIKLGTGADAIFGYKQKQMRMEAKNNPQAAANKQVQLITETNRRLAELIRLQSETTVVTA